MKTNQIKLPSIMNTESVSKPFTSYRRVLIFDVETTGLIKKNSALPYILQLSFVVYDIQEKKIIKKFNEYIQIPESIVIDPFIVQLTGITNELCATKGIDILEALHAFYNAYMTCDCIVAHNLEFDKEMIQIELSRNSMKIQETYFYMMLLFNEKYSTIFKIDHYCTMKSNIEFCSLYFANSKRKKYPKLIELYQTLFDETPAHLHNSIVDVLVCLRCFLKRHFCIDIPSPLFNHLLAER